SLIFFIIPPPPTSTLFPYTTLFRSVFLDAAGKPHFASGYGYADFILNNVFKTGAPRFPVNLLLEFEDNLDAAAHPFDSKGKVLRDRKSTRLNSSHLVISYAVFCLKK